MTIRSRRSFPYAIVATALLWRAMTAGELTMATHDEALGVAATAHGLPVIGSG